MGPSQNDFVNQFEQQISSSGSSKGGDIILASDKPAGKSKKPVIIAAVAVVALLIVLVAVMMFLPKTGGRTSEYKNLAKEYAGYFIFGPNDGNSGESLSENEYYFNIFGQNDDYLENIKAKLVALEEAASNESDKKSARLQLDRTIAYNNALNCLQDINDKCVTIAPETISDSELINFYKQTSQYVEKESARVNAEYEYENMEIEQSEYSEYVVNSGRAAIVLQNAQSGIRNQLSAYAKELYEKY